jgi:hypothetical protein
MRLRSRLAKSFLALALLYSVTATECAWATDATAIVRPQTNAAADVFLTHLTAPEPKP